MFIHQEKTRYCASWIYTFGAQERWVENDQGPALSYH